MKLAKELLTLFTAIFLLIVAFPSCDSNGLTSSQNTVARNEFNTHSKEGNDAEKVTPLRILLDLEFASNVTVSIKDAMQEYYQKDVDKKGRPLWASFQERITQLGGPETQVEIPPSHGPERDNYLTRLRTEIMAGAGPDVFVCMSGMGYYWDQKLQDGLYTYPLFKFPQQAMKRGFFLSLDSYLEKAKFIDWSGLTSTIMEGGRNGNEQSLIPMTYTIPATIFYKKDIKYEPSQTLTWADMCSSDPALQVAALSDESAQMGTALEPLCDFENDTLAFTEDELLNYMSIKSNWRNESNLHFGIGSPRVGMDIYMENATNFSEDDAIILIPIYNRQGGYRAIINSFAAINANTEDPEKAFFVLDYLLGEECQSSKLYSFMTVDQGIPVLESLMAENKGVSCGDGSKEWQMWRNYYPEFTRLRNGIVGVDYCTLISVEIQELWADVIASPDQHIEELVHDAYMRMCMEIAES